MTNFYQILNDDKSYNTLKLVAKFSTRLSNRLTDVLDTWVSAGHSVDG